ncbi:MAG: RsmD family RNA methyltransferase [Planctomycetota bacterium]
MKAKAKTDRTTPPGRAEHTLRIIGGRWRQAKLAYHGDLVTRPMKHRVREAIFNLVGPAVQGKHAVDLFAGTGALGLEALSRGAAGATFIERHLPTADVVKQNIAALGAGEQSELLITSAFLWSKRDLPAIKGPTSDHATQQTDARLPLPPAATPWVVFVSPPYAFFVDRRDEMIALVDALRAHAPADSLIVVETDERFDFALLPGRVRPDRHSDGWDVREYPPARVGVWRCGVGGGPD